MPYKSENQRPETTVPRIVGYARTSTTSQHLDLQLYALRALGADPIFTDQASGAATKRPGLAQALAAVRPGDTLAVWKLDRFGRSLAGLIRAVNELRERGIRIRSITESIDTDTAHGRLLLGLFGTLAEYERDLIRERITAGILSARRAGRPLGRPAKLDPLKAEAALRELDAGRPPREVARNLGMARSTLYKGLEQYRAEQAGLLGVRFEKRPRGRPRKAVVAHTQRTAG